MSQVIKITARAIIHKSMQTLGALGQGENTTEQEANDALFILNEIVDKWNIEKLMIPSSIDITFPVSGKKFYTMGLYTGDLSPYDDEYGRPPSGIDGAYYIMNTSNNKVSIPLKKITQQQYNDLTLKDLQVQIPEYYFYNNSYPLAQLYIYPISSQGSVTITVSDQFTGFRTLDKVIDMPSAYITALRYTLSVMLASEYGRTVTDEVKQLAIGAKTTIKSLNSSIKKEIMRADAGILGRPGGGFNIYSGD